MTQKDKQQLLLKDLCARLPYKVKIRIQKLDEEKVIDNEDFGYMWLGMIFFNNPYHNIKPYLRPLSSMTEEEKKEFAEVVVRSQDCSYENNESATTIVNDWYLSKGFDVRGLIPKGLAIEAPEGMYK